MVDTRGLPLMVMVTPVDLHDSQAAKEVLFRLRLMHPELTIVWADRAYAGKLVTWAKEHLNLTIKTVSRPKDTSGARSRGSCTPADTQGTTNGSSSTPNP